MMWQLFKNLNNYTELLELSPSDFYSKSRIVEKIDGESLIEKSNQLVHIHSDECWRKKPPSKLYLYCESTGKGGESLVCNFSRVDCPKELKLFLESFDFKILVGSELYQFKVINHGFFKLHQNHKELLKQIKSKKIRGLFSDYIGELKSKTEVIMLKPNQGLIVDNHYACHGRLAYEGDRKLIKVLGYENTSCNPVI